MKERLSLETLYKQLDDAKYCLTNRLILAESEHWTDKMVTVFFVDVLDDLCDLGHWTYQRNNKTIPSSEFEKEYQQDRYPLRDLRGWLALQHVEGRALRHVEGPALQPLKGCDAAIILARLACLRSCLDLILITPATGGPRIDRKKRLTDALTYAETLDDETDKTLNLPTDVPSKLDKYLRRDQK